MRGSDDGYESFSTRPAFIHGWIVFLSELSVANSFSADPTHGAAEMSEFDLAVAGTSTHSFATSMHSGIVVAQAEAAEAQAISSCPAIVMPEFGCAETRPAEFQDRLRCLGPLFASCSGWIFRSAERARHRFNPTIQIPTCGCVVVYVAACPSCVHSNINQIPSIIPGVSHVARP